MSSDTKKAHLKILRDRRARGRTAPGFPSRRGESLVDGMTKGEIVLRYAAQVRMIAQKIARELPQSIELDDLVSQGFIGLMDAADRFDPTNGAKFSTYAEFRIRGSILDSLRQQDWVPRSVRDRIKSMERAQAQIERSKGAPATDGEVSKLMGIKRDAYQKLRTDLGSLALVHVADETELALQMSGHSGGLADDPTPGAPAPDPFTHTSRKIAQEFFDGLFKTLSENERLVMTCYYYRGLNLREISRILSVTESRVSQIHGQAVHKLKQKLKERFADPHEIFVSLLAA